MLDQHLKVCRRSKIKNIIITENLNIIKQFILGRTNTHVLVHSNSKAVETTSLAISLHTLELSE